MDNRRNNNKTSNKRRGGDNRRQKVVSCDLVTFGICIKQNCNKVFHRNIVMDNSWIKKNTPSYISEMLRLEAEHCLPFSKGALNYLEKHKTLLTDLPIEHLFSVFMTNPSPASFYAKVLSLEPAKVDIFFSFAEKEYNRKYYDPLRKILKYNHRNLSEFPFMRQQLEINSIFPFVDQSKYRLQDSMLVAFYGSISFEARKLLFKKLEQLYGSDYPLIERIRNDYQVGLTSSRTSQKSYEDIRKKRHDAIHDRSNGFALPEDVSICFINNADTLRIEILSMLKEVVLGWDTEWFAPIDQPSFPSIIQISGEKRVWLIDGLWMKYSADTLLNSIFAVLVNAKHITHVFKGKEDISILKKLFREYPCFTKLTNTVNIDWILLNLGFQNTSLSSQTAFFLGKKLIKKDTFTDWNQRPLDQRQTYYAAMDAYVTRKIFIKAAYLILNEVPASRVTENIEAFTKERSEDNKTNSPLRYRVTTSESLQKLLNSSAVLCKDYGM